MGRVRNPQRGTAAACHRCAHIAAQEEVAVPSHREAAAIPTHRRVIFSGMRAVALILGGWAVVIGVGLLLFGLWGAGFSDSTASSRARILTLLIAGAVVTIFGIVLIFVSRRAGRR